MRIEELEVILNGIKAGGKWQTRSGGGKWITPANQTLTNLCSIIATTNGEIRMFPHAGFVAWDRTNYPDKPIYISDSKREILYRLAPEKILGFTLSGVNYTPEELLNNFEWTTDLKTWYPCGVMEKEPTYGNK